MDSSTAFSAIIQLQPHSEIKLIYPISVFLDGMTGAILGKKDMSNSHFNIENLAVCLDHLRMKVMK